MRAVPSLICDRVRSQVSLSLDGELSELERMMVARHLERCVDCRAFSDGAVEITNKIRTAPLERFERRVVLPRLHRGRLVGCSRRRREGRRDGGRHRDRARSRAR